MGNDEMKVRPICTFIILTWSKYQLGMLLACKNCSAATYGSSERERERERGREREREKGVEL